MNKLICMALLVLLAGCSIVQPWQRGSLAREDMQWQPDVMDARLREQQARRFELMAPHVASTGTDGIYEVIEEVTPPS